jgi:hypothetical protein
MDTSMTLACYSLIQASRLEGILLGSSITLAGVMVGVIISELCNGRPIYLIPTVGTTDFDIGDSSSEEEGDSSEEELEEEGNPSNEEEDGGDESSEEDEDERENTTTISEDDEPTQPTESSTETPTVESPSKDSDVANYLLQGFVQSNITSQEVKVAPTVTKRRLPGSVRARARSMSSASSMPSMYPDQSHGDPMKSKDSFLNYSCRDKNYNTQGDEDVKKIRYRMMVDGVKTYIGKPYNESTIVEIKNKHGCSIVPTIVNNLKVDSPAPWYSYDIGRLLGVPVEVTDRDYDRKTNEFSSDARITRVI